MRCLLNAESIVRRRCWLALSRLSVVVFVLFSVALFLSCQQDSITEDQDLDVPAIEDDGDDASEGTESGQDVSGTTETQVNGGAQEFDAEGSSASIAIESVVEADDPTDVEVVDAETGDAPDMLPECDSFASFPVAESIHGLLASDYEPSGLVWHSVLQKLFLVSDEGVITQMNADGTDVVNWTIGGDLEAITIADENSDFVYVGLEKPNDSIIEFNFVTGDVVRVFDVSSFMTSTDSNLGLEALAFVPSDDEIEGGLFYAGLQATGEVFVFSLPIESSATDETVSFAGKFQPVSGRNQISDLSYNASHSDLYALYHSTLTQLTPDGDFVDEWSVPGQAQEGIAFDAESCTLFIAQDSGEVYRYGF